MIKINPTPNYAGMEMVGDIHNFKELYNALHRITGEEGEFPDYDAARLRILGLCYDLRHAATGDREYVYLDHGLDADTMKWMGIVGPTKNLYVSFATYYPEMLFIVMALNDFIKIYERKKAIHQQRDVTIMTTRQFQAKIIQSLSETLKPQTFKTMLRNISRYNVHFKDYYTQYIDELNIRFLNWNKEKRVKNISIMAKRIAEQGEAYQNIKQQIRKAAIAYNCHPSQLELNKEYPEWEEIVW